ncbi:MAG: metalloregulator ArsR/SmtB family transcription factor [Chloroflexota bacterium]|nr:metalloregulator ArsR/SmtB family transcription factor [Chloroflexota bacterium]
MMAGMAPSTDPDIRLLQALADPIRLTIVRELAGQPEVCACDFTSCCDVSQPTISHHLKVLREAGVIAGERRGTWIFYRLQPAAARRLERLAATISAGAGVAAGAGAGTTLTAAGTRMLPVLPG